MVLTIRGLRQLTGNSCIVLRAAAETLLRILKNLQKPVGDLSDPSIVAIVNRLRSLGREKQTDVLTSLQRPGVSRGSLRVRGVTFLLRIPLHPALVENTCGHRMRLDRSYERKPASNRSYDLERWG
jgi:hypothetical protein